MMKQSEENISFRAEVFLIKRAQWLLSMTIICLALCQAWLGRSVHFSNRESSESYWGAQVNPGFVKRFLGLRTVVSDLLWIDILYKSDIKREEFHFTDFYKASQAMMALDPHNIIAAWFCALYLSVIKDDIHGATVLFEQAIQNIEAEPHIDQWVDQQALGALYYSYGYHLLYEENDPARAGLFLKKAAQSPKAPELVRALAKDLATERGQIEVGFRILNSYHRRARSPAEKQKIEVKMTALLVRRENLELNEKFSAFKMREGLEGLARGRAFQFFLRSMNHRGRDLLGRILVLDQTGRIVSK